MNEELNSEIKKLIPKVYDDALQPSVIEIGKSIKETVKLVLKPYNGLIWSIDKSFDWLTNTLSKKISSKNIKKIKSPNIETTIKVIQGIQTTGSIENPIPRNLFANLLFSEMNKDWEIITHPAFAETLKQMTLVECKIVCVLANRPFIITDTETYHNSSGPWKFLDELGYRNKTFDLNEKCQFDKDLELYFYLVNLERLGIIEINNKLYEEKPTGSKEEEMIYNREMILFEKHREKYKGYPDCPTSTSVSINMIRQTSFGESFLKAIDASEFYNHELNEFRIDGKE